MRVFFLALSLFALTNYLSGQKQNNIWYFGSHAGLDFNFPVPTPITSDLVSIGSPSSAADPNGNLLFYTNGRIVWDRNHKIMPNGVGLAGGPASAQPALIVPWPNSNSRYFIFTTEDNTTNGGMSYSIVDMNLNGGFGDIIASSKNTLIVDFTANKPTAILHPNGKDVWVISHRFNSDEFLSYLITDSGLSSFPIVSSVGSILPAESGNHGTLKGSKSGSKLLLASVNSDIVELFNFDSSNGTISDVFEIDDYLDDQLDVYGVEFSPDDSLVYLSTFQQGFFVNHLYQFHIQSQLLTYLNNPFKANPGDLQLGPDGKIYVIGSAGAVSVIHQPNRVGISCQFEFNSIILEPGTSTLFGFPARIPYSFFLDDQSLPSLGNDTSLCSGDSLILDANFPTNCDSTEYFWSDGSSGSELVIHQPGAYWVEINSECGVLRDTILIESVTCLPIVHYNFEACVSYMHNGTNMDYSEFTPAYPNLLSCADVTANFAYRSPPQENKHSCTPGVNNSVAMCISSYDDCSFSADRDEALIFEITIVPGMDSIFQMTSLEFYQKAPLNYNWIDGPSGLNNYPTKYGIRILKNDFEIFHEEDIETSQTWVLESFDFNQSDFKVDDSAFFKIEILPYCLVGNGATVAAWDIDELKVYGACRKVESAPIISGRIVSVNGKVMANVEVRVSNDSTFGSFLETRTDESGNYEIEVEKSIDPYYIRPGYNYDILNGLNALDLIFIQKHLLGIQPFETVFKFIASDLDKNGKVSVLDLVLLKKLMLGRLQTLPNNTSWRFGVFHEDFNGTDLTKFKEMHKLFLQEGKSTNVDFIGVKVGDANGSAQLD